MIDFSDYCVFEQLEHDCYKAAMVGERINFSIFPANEYKYFMQLYNLYLDFRYNDIDTDTASKQKLKYKQEYRNNKHNDDEIRKVFVCYQENIKRSEQNISALTKGEYSDIYEAFAMAIDIISAMRGEDTTGKTIMEKVRRFDKNQAG